MKVMDVSDCDISDKGAESLARALAASSSLEKLNISFNRIGDNGIAHIAIALQENNTLKSLTLHDCIDTATDKAALSLVAALTTNTSMKVMKLGWTSTHPDTTLKNMAERFKKNTLRELEIEILKPKPSAGQPQVSEEKTRQWLKYVRVGGKEFILSLEDSRLASFSLSHPHYDFMSSLRDLNSQICMSLKEVATSVNLKRKMNCLPEIKFSISI